MVMYVSATMIFNESLSFQWRGQHASCTNLPWRLQSLTPASDSSNRSSKNWLVTLHKRESPPPTCKSDTSQQPAGCSEQQTETLSVNPWGLANAARLQTWVLDELKITDHNLFTTGLNQYPVHNLKQTGGRGLQFWDHTELWWRD